MFKVRFTRTNVVVEIELVAAFGVDRRVSGHALFSSWLTQLSRRGNRMRCLVAKAGMSQLPRRRRLRRKHFTLHEVRDSQLACY
jgi:hypothetical protein